MREYLTWSLPGLMLAAPVHLILTPNTPWTAWLLISPAVGAVLHQVVRWQFERTDGGFRNPRRGALEAIIERGGLADRSDRGDVAYQVYEVVFYERQDWEAIRGHAHRCWDWIFLFQSTALAASLGSVLSAAALIVSPHRLLAAALLVGLTSAAFVLGQKARQTESALQLFDRGLVLSHWPMYEHVLQEILAATANVVNR